MRKARYPLALPFDLWAETVREACDHFETPLERVMETLRPSDALFDDDQPFDRFAIWMESLRLSPADVAIFTDPDPLTGWHELYGYENAQEATTEAIDEDTGERIDLHAAKTLSRRLGVTYGELVQIVEAGFVNPELSRLSLLFKLGLGVGDARFYLDHRALLNEDPETLSTEDQQSRLEAQAFAARLDQAGLVDSDIEGIPFDKILLLSDPSADGNFDLTTIRHADGEPADKIAFLRINLFVRLWRRLGWSIEDTDRALQAFVPKGAPFGPPHLNKRPLETALIYLAHLKALDDALDLGPGGRNKALALWSDIATQGRNPLYAELFLGRNVLKIDSVFDDPRGDYLAAPFKALKDHLPAVQVALGVTAEEVGAILEEARDTLDDAKLAVSSLSLLYRYRLLATALKLSIRDLIVLKQLSGLDPFMPLDPDPLPRTPAGAALALDHPFSRTLRFVEMAKAIRQSGLKLADLDYLFRHREAADGKRPAPESALLKSLADGINAIRADHDAPADPADISDDLLRQKLGLILAPEVAGTLMSILIGATPASRDFFDRHLKRILGDDGVARFLEDEAFDTVFGPLTPLVPILPEDTEQEVQTKQQQNDDIRRDNLKELVQRRARIAGAFLPVLQQRLIRKLVIDTMAVRFDADPAMVEDLLSKQKLIDRDETLLELLSAIGKVPSGPGFFDPEGNLSENADEAQFTGYLAVPTSGAYRFLISLPKKNAVATVRFDHLAGPFLTAKTETANSVLGEGENEYLQLEPGRYYGFSLDLKGLGSGGAQLQVESETMPRSGISRLLQSADAIDAAQRAIILLAKVLQLAGALALNVRELRHLLTNLAFDPPAEAILDLPTAPGDDDPARDLRLFGMFQRWIAYARLKQEMVAGRDELIDIFEAKKGAGEEPLGTGVHPLVAALVGRDAATVAAVAADMAAALGTSGINSEKPLWRLWNALQLTERFALPVSTLVEWARIVHSDADNEPRPAMARDAREAIKAGMSPEAWRRVAQPIFDRLRRRQRDALTGFVLRQRKLGTVEKLYEYFLADPGMEPVVQTSRIRLAIASLQLFIQRSLLNMEDEVHPSAINARHWEWMKRYRLWEANRKIFLFPENWLEPEFRDNKTHLFAELEGALLQGDVSADLAEDAFLAYLKKLDELARLDIVAMHLDGAEPDTRTLHVIGRSYGKPHKYFYRRYRLAGLDALGADGRRNSG